MRFPLGIILFVFGAGVMLYGMGSALRDLSSVYQGALEKPLDTPQRDEKVVSQDMIRQLITGAAGVPFVIVGDALHAVGERRRRAERRRAGGERRSGRD